MHKGTKRKRDATPTPEASTDTDGEVASSERATEQEETPSRQSAPNRIDDEDEPVAKKRTQADRHFELLTSTFKQPRQVDCEDSPPGVLESLAPWRFKQQTFKIVPFHKPAKPAPPKIFAEQICGFVSEPIQDSVRNALTLTDDSRGQRASPYAATTRSIRMKSIELHCIPTTAEEVAAAPTDVLGEADPNLNNPLHIAAWNLIQKACARLRFGDRDGRDQLRVLGEHEKAICTRIPGIAEDMDHSSTAQPVPVELSRLRDELYAQSDAEAAGLIVLGPNRAPPPPRVGQMDPDELFRRVSDAKLNLFLEDDVFRNVMTDTVDPTSAAELLHTSYGAFQLCVCGESCLMLRYSRELEMIAWKPAGLPANTPRPASRPGMAYLCANDRRIVAQATRDGTDVHFRTPYPMMCLMCIRFQQAKNITTSFAGINSENPSDPINITARQRTVNVTRDIGYNPARCYPPATAFTNGAFGPIRHFSTHDYVPYIAFIEAAPRYGGQQVVLAFAEKSVDFFDRAAMSIPNTRFVCSPIWPSIREGVVRGSVTIEALIAATAVAPRCIPPMDTRDGALFFMRSLRITAYDLRTRLIEMAKEADGPVPDGLLPTMPSKTSQVRPSASESISARLKTVKPGGSVTESFIGHPTVRDKEDEEDEDKRSEDSDEDFAADLMQEFERVSNLPQRSAQADNLWTRLKPLHLKEWELACTKPRILQTDTISIDLSSEPSVEVPAQVLRFHIDAAVRSYSCYWVTMRIPALRQLLTAVGADTLRGAAAHSMFLTAIMQAKFAEHSFRKGKAPTEDVRLLHYNYMLAKRNAMTWFLEQASFGNRIDDVRILTDLQSPTFGSGEVAVGGVYSALLPTRSLHIPRPVLRVVKETYPRTTVFCQRAGTQALLETLKIVSASDAHLLTTVPFVQAVEAVMSDAKVWSRLTGICRQFVGHLTVAKSFFEQVLGRTCGGVANIQYVEGMDLRALWTWTALGRANRALSLLFSAQLCTSSEALARLPDSTFDGVCENPLSPVGSHKRMLHTTDYATAQALACRRFRNSLSGLMCHLAHVITHHHRSVVSGTHTPARTLMQIDPDMPTEDSLYIPPAASPWCGDIPDMMQALHACGLLSCDSSQFSANVKATRGTNMAAQRIARKRKSADVIMAPMFKSLSDRTVKVPQVPTSKTKKRPPKPSKLYVQQQRKMQQSGQTHAKSQPRKRTKAQSAKLAAILALNAPPPQVQEEKKVGEKGTRNAPRRRNYPTVGTSTALWGDDAIDTQRAASRGGIAVWFGGDGTTMRGIVRVLSLLFPRESVDAEFVYPEGHITVRLVQALRDLASNTTDAAITTFLITSVLSGLGGLYPWSTASVDLFGWTSICASLDGGHVRGRLADWIIQNPATAVVCLRQAVVFALSNAPAVVHSLQLADSNGIDNFARKTVATGNLLAKMVARKMSWSDIESRLSGGGGGMVHPTSFPVIRPLGLSAAACVYHICAHAKTIRGNSTKAAAAAFVSILSRKELFHKRAAAAANPDTNMVGSGRNAKGSKRGNTRILMANIKNASKLAAQQVQVSHEIEEALQKAMKTLEKDPARALDAREYATSVEWMVVQIMMSCTVAGVLPGPELVAYVTRLGGGLWEQDMNEPWTRRNYRILERDVQRVVRAYGVIVAACSCQVPIEGPNGALAAMDALSNRLWRSLYGFLQAFIAHAGVQITWTSDSAVVAAQRIVRIASCSDTHPEKGGRSGEPLVSLATCQASNAFKSPQVDAITSSYLRSRAVTFTVRPCCSVMATPFLGQGAMKSSVTARGTKDVTYDTSDKANKCRAGARNRRRRAVQNATLQKAVQNSTTDILQTRAELLRHKNAVSMAEMVAKASEKCAGDAEAAAVRNLSDPILQDLARVARGRALAAQENTAAMRLALEKAEVKVANATAQAVFISSTAASAAVQAEEEIIEDEEATMRRAAKQKQAPPQSKAAPQELRCSNFFISDSEGLGTTITFGSYYRRYKEGRRGGEVVSAACCCERYASVDMLEFSGAMPFTCPTCILPLKRRGARGTGTISSSATATALANNAYMTAVAPMTGTPRTGIYSPWRDFSDRTCAVCNHPANPNIVVTLYSRGLNGQGLATFTDGFFCAACATTVSTALNRDSQNGTLHGTFVSRDWLQLLAAASSGSGHSLVGGQTKQPAQRRVGTK